MRRCLSLAGNLKHYVELGSVHISLNTLCPSFSRRLSLTGGREYHIESGSIDTSLDVLSRLSSCTGILRGTRPIVYPSINQDSNMYIEIQEIVLAPPGRPQISY